MNYVGHRRETGGVGPRCDGGHLQSSRRRSALPRDIEGDQREHLGNESARLRFLREARAAASVRHPNVASVFHLGRSAEGYFYAMEFVEGETLENLIKRSGKIEIKLALEIAHKSLAV